MGAHVINLLGLVKEEVALPAPPRSFVESDMRGALRSMCEDDADDMLVLLSVLCAVRCYGCLSSEKEVDVARSAAVPLVWLPSVMTWHRVFRARKKNFWPNAVHFSQRITRSKLSHGRESPLSHRLTSLQSRDSTAAPHVFAFSAPLRPSRTYKLTGKRFGKKKKPKKILKSTRSSPEKMASTMMPTCAGLSAPGRRRKGAPRRYTHTLPSLFLSVIKNTSRVAPARGFFSSNLFANLFSRENKQQKDC
jgi:hypothetical protein